MKKPKEQKLKAGAPLRYPSYGATERATVTIPKTIREVLEKAGGGSISAGIVKAGEALMDKTKRAQKGA